MKYIVVDIDGTIAQIHPERLKLIQGKNKDWDAFYKACHMDTPIQNVIDMIEIMICDSYCEWVFVTGRSEICRQETFDWLNKHMEYYASDSDICMRKEGDFRPDTEVKPELLNKYMEDFGLDKEDILVIFEDRDSVVEKWRELGYTVAQVAKGDF